MRTAPHEPDIRSCEAAGASRLPTARTGLFARPARARRPEGLLIEGARFISLAIIGLPRSTVKPFFFIDSVAGIQRLVPVVLVTVDPRRIQEALKPFDPSNGLEGDGTIRGRVLHAQLGT